MPFTATVNARLAPLALFSRSWVPSTSSSQAISQGKGESASATGSGRSGRRQDGRCTASRARPRPAVKVQKITSVSSWSPRLAILPLSCSCQSRPPRISDGAAAEGEDGGQADRQGERAAAQAAHRQPADHRLGQQLLQQAPAEDPQQRASDQAGDEGPAVFRLPGQGEGVADLSANQLVQPGQVIVGGADQGRPEARAQRWRVARLAICELNRLRRRLTICAARSWAFLSSWLARSCCFCCCF